MITRNIDIVFENSITNKEAILRHLTVLYGTNAGEQAQDRSFGIDWSALSQPIEVAKAMLSTEIIEKTAKYEPKATITGIDFTADVYGHLNPIVHVEEARNE